MLVLRARFSENVRMTFRTTRREWIAGTLAASVSAGAPRPAGILIDTHIHLFAADQKRFPYHHNAPYRPEPATLEDYVAFVRQVKLDGAVIVHPEPYQDDHRYLEYCLEREPFRGFFKGTCLFDPIAPDTPARMEALVRKYPGRIVALRIHQMRNAGEPPARTGPIKERDPGAPGMTEVWKKAQSLGLAIQMHFVPAHAPGIHALASRFPDLPVVLDHLGRPGQGTKDEYREVLRLAKLRNIRMKFSGVRYASRQEPPFADAKPLIRQICDAFTPDRMIWGGLGMNVRDFEQNVTMFDSMFDFLSESERARIRGTNAGTLFGFAKK